MLFVRPLLIGLAAVGLLAFPLLADVPARESGPSDLASSPTDAGPVQVQVDVVAIPCPPGFDTGVDNACLAYDGQIPGPTFVFHEGDTVEMTVTNRIAETVAPLDLPQSTKDNFAATNVSLHRHGLRLLAVDDGVAPAPGSVIPDSTIGPGQSRTYTFDTQFVNFWHYHDHTMFGNELVGSPIERGLFGAFITLPFGVDTDHAFDLHLMNAGPNGGLGFNADVQARERFDLNIIGLGDYSWDFVWSAPHVPFSRTIEVGPGVSRGITVHEAVTGVYEWQATSPELPGTVYRGEVRVS